MDIHPISSFPSTAFLLVDDGRAMLVDASMPAAAPKILARLNALHVPLHLIVLTHFHYDHVGGADAVRRATGAKIAVHRRDADALRRGGRLSLAPTRLTAGLMAPRINRTEQRPVTPDIELDDEEDLSRHGGFGHTFATPGHTRGSICVALDDGTVFAGDTLSAGLLTHRAMLPLFLEDPEANGAAVRAIASRATTVYVSHYRDGKVDAESLRRFADRSVRPPRRTADPTME